MVHRFSSSKQRKAVMARLRHQSAIRLGRSLPADLKTVQQLNPEHRLALARARIALSKAPPRERLELLLTKHPKAAAALLTTAEALTLTGSAVVEALALGSGNIPIAVGAVPAAIASYTGSKLAKEQQRKAIALRERNYQRERKAGFPPKQAAELADAAFVKRYRKEVLT